MAKVVRPHFRHGTIVGVLRECSLIERFSLIAMDREWRDHRIIWLCAMVTGARGLEMGTGHAAYLLPGDEGWIADEYLRPIRDPGEDTQDETLSWLPVPSCDEVGA